MPPFPTLWRHAALCLLVGCGSTARPGSLGNDVPGFTSDFGSTEGGTPFDAILLPEGGADGGLDGTPDAPASDQGEAGDALGDAFGDAFGDARVSTLCGFSPDILDQLAVRLATCTHDAPQHLAEQLYRPEYWEGGVYPLRSCATLVSCVARTDCASLFGECLKYFVQPPPDGGVCAVTPQCSANAPGTSGHYATRCANGYVTLEDCEPQGRCVATSTEVTCAAMDAAACNPGDPPRCAGDTLEHCIARAYVPALRCAVTGGRCDAAADGCVGTGDACSGDAARCDGTYLQRCQHGRYQTMDCNALVRGASCQQVGTTAFCGTAADCDPTQGSPGGRCEGNVLVTCSGGRLARFDCAARGYTGCGPAGCVP